MNALLGRSNEEALKAAFTSNHHAYLLIGKSLSGLRQSIEKCAKSTLNGVVVTFLQPEDDKHITIQQVRKLKQSLSLKQSMKQSRLLIIENCQTMTPEAQNSFLKLLEEPPENLRFLLLSSSKVDLLKTIQSRVISTKLQKVSLDDAAEYYQKTNDGEAIKKAHAVADGEPGKLFLLLSENSSRYFEAITYAKKLISADVFERLSQLDLVAKDKQYLIEIVSAIDDVLRALQRSERSTSKMIKQLSKKRDTLHSALKSLERNVNTKLVALDVLLSL